MNEDTAAEAPIIAVIRCSEVWQTGSYLDRFHDALIKRGAKVFTNFPDQYRQHPRRYWHFHAPHYVLNSRPGLLKLTFLLQLAWQMVKWRLSGGRFAWTCHDLSDLSKRNRRTVSVMNFILSRVSDFIICHCEGAAKELSRKFKVNHNKIKISPHPAYVGLYPNEVSSETAKSVLGITPGRRVYLLLGNLRWYKGALEFWNALCESAGESFIFLIAGRVEAQKLATRLQEIAAEDCRMQLRFGEIPPQLLQLYYKAADVAVCPYTDITTSGAANLAMSFAKPILASNQCCLGEALDAKGSWTYSRSDKEGLLRCIIAAHNASESTLMEMGQHNLERARVLTWDALASCALDSYTIAPSK
jgi:glycosyltransferase involved in cell wall biosynthesis